jgi:hypothetical protein
MKKAHRKTSPVVATSSTLNRVESLESRTLLTVFTVTNTNDGGAGSLRDALNQSNNTAGVDTIAFNISAASKVIRPASELPGLWDPTILDATTQPGYAGKPLVQIDGGGAGYTGIKMWGGSTIKGISLTNFNSGAIDMFNRGFGGNTVQASWIGVDLAGNLAGSTASGIGIWNTANNLVGGPNAADRNVISGSKGALGVLVQGSAATNNVIQNNYIGTDPTGNLARPNAKNGIGVQDAPNTKILNNVVSGNTNDGIIILNPNATGTIVQGNIVGLNAAGTATLPNLWYGIEIQSANNTIGGTTAAQRNVFSGNGESGVVLYLSSAANNLIQGNYIGTDVTGNVDLGNVYQGIAISEGPNGNQIKGNLISGNDAEGVGIFPGNNNTVQGNTIGLSAAGTPLTNRTWAVTLINSSGNVIGGTAAGQANVIYSGHPSGTIYNGGGNTVSTNQIVSSTTTSVPGSFAFSASSYSAAENAGSVTVTVTRTIGTTVAASVNYATSNGTATSGSDYTAATGTLNFAAGETSKTFTVSLLNDSTVEADETVWLTLSSPTAGATLANPSTATLTITNDDAAPIPGQFALGASTYAANENQGTVTITVTRSAGSTVAASVNYATANGTATAGQDYTAASGTLNFAAGETSKTFTIALTNDSQIESPETVGISLSSPTAGATLGSPAAATLTITSDDLPDTTPPTVTSAQFIYTSAQHKLRYSFSENVSATLSAAQDLYVVDTTTFQSYSPTGYSYDTATNTATFTFAGQMPKGAYQAYLFSTAVSDAAGNELDGDGNGTAGGVNVLDFHFIAGDANGDGAVDFNDLVAMSRNYNATGGMTWSQGDFNYDGTVDFKDLVLLSQNYNTTAGAIAAPQAAAIAPTPTFANATQPTVAAQVTATPTAPKPAKPAATKRPNLFSSKRI